MHGSRSPDASDAAKAFGIPQRSAWRVQPPGSHWASRVVIALVLASWLALLGLGFPVGRALLRDGSPYPSCEAARISTPEGREGVCARGGGLLGAATVYNVVDRARVLSMPEYQASLLASRIAPTRVRNFARNADLYPGGRGQLVSLEVSIANTSDRPLQFGEAAADARLASYPRHAIVELLLPQSPGSVQDIGYPAIVNGRGAPTPSVFRPLAIAPHERVIGWVSFVAAAWSLSVLHSRPADLDFLRTDGDTNYVGQIRLWK
jgi:hypothetical protein